jgi:hypothetical protein
MSSSRPIRPASLRKLFGRLKVRLALVAGGLVLLRLNAEVGGLLGFSAPVTPEAITIDFARVLAATLGLWMVYRGVR